MLVCVTSGVEWLHRTHSLDIIKPSTSLTSLWSLPHSPIIKQHQIKAPKTADAKNMGGMSSHVTGRTEQQSPSNSGRWNFFSFKTKSNQSTPTTKEAPDKLGVSPPHTRLSHSPSLGDLMCDPLGPVAGSHEDEGTLHPAMFLLTPQWLEYCAEQGVPSVFKTVYELPARHSVPAVLQDCLKLCGSALQGMPAECFRSNTDEDGKVSFTPHNFDRRALGSASEDHESTLDFSRPSRSCTYPQAEHVLLIARCPNQWKAAVADPCSSLTVAALTDAKTHKSVMKFVPFFHGEGAGGDQRLPLGLMPCDNIFLPRQRILIIEAKDRQLKLLTYNISSETRAQLERRLTQLSHWHDARATLLQDLLAQKLGLFHHSALSTPQDNSNPYLSVGLQEEARSLIGLLVTETQAPDPLKRTQSRGRADKGGTYPLHVENVLQDVHPAALQPLRPDAHLDPVMAHGQQAMAAQQWMHKACQTMYSLEELYQLWNKHSANASVPVTVEYVSNEEELVQQLCRESRLVHHCATPLLFYRHYRHKVSGGPGGSNVDSTKSANGSLSVGGGSIDSDAPTGRGSQKGSDGGRLLSLSRARHTASSSTLHGRNTPQRSRHGSGNSHVSGRSESVERGGSSTPPGASRRGAEEPEPAWHMQLRSLFLKDYVQYLHSIGFLQVTVRESKVRPLQQPRGKSQTAQKQHEHVPARTYLRKGLIGGLLVIELSFVKEYFCVSIYALECSRLTHVKYNQNHLLIFCDEVDSMKDLIHIHSFAHDFHLRCIQGCVSGRPDPLPLNYHLVAFLHDFIALYPRAPAFSRNALAKDDMEFSELNTSAEELFIYMLRHEDKHDMRALTIAHESTCDVDDTSEHALVSFSQCSSTQSGRTDYDVGVVLCQGAPHELRFFVVLTAQRDRFPRSTANNENHNLLTSPTHQSLSNVCYSASPIMSSDLLGRMTPPAPPTPVSSKYNTEIRVEARQLGFCSVQQGMLYTLLHDRAKIVRKKIGEMVEKCQHQCHRDVLWQKLVNPEPDVKLTLTDFDHMLPLAECASKSGLQQLALIDPRLSFLQTLPPAHCATLAQKLLTTLPPDDTRALFDDAGNIRHLAVLNPDYSDMFTLVSVDLKQSRSEVSVVYRDGPPEPRTEQCQLARQHVQHFVNACAAHLWTELL